MGVKAHEETAVRIELLGAFRVWVEGEELPHDVWPGRRSAELVQLLALAPGRKLTRDAVIEALWPHLTADAGGANLRKAAYHARQALGSADAVVLRSGEVALLPDTGVATDVAKFERKAAGALASGDPEAASQAAALYAEDLLPGAAYEEWARVPRERLRETYVKLLRASGEWDRLVEIQPTDEDAYRRLMQRDLEAGRRPSAIRWFGRLRAALTRDLGVLPDAETLALYDECIAGLSAAEPRLIGRDVELARLTALLREGPDTNAAIVAIRGSAGIGKSALCRELAAMAESEGWVAVGVAADEAASPYAPLVAAAEQLLASKRELLDAISAPARAVLAELTPVAAPADSLENPPSRHRVIGAVRQLLLATGGGEPVMLIVDDAHLADESTLDVLNHLGSAGAPPVLPVLAYRLESAQESLSRGLARLVRAGRAVELDLNPLEPEDAKALVAAVAASPRPEEVLDRIVELGQGNPFLTVELAQSAVSGVPALVPTAREAIRRRFVDLDEGDSDMLRRLALAGDNLDPVMAVALTGAGEEDAFAALDSALAAGILVISEERYRFRHALVRQALVDELPPHRRGKVHREIAARLAHAGANPGVIARHWLEGGEPEEAAPWFLEAARRALELGAYSDSVRYLDSLLDQQPSDVEALRLRAESLDALGDRRCLAAYDAAAEAAAEPLAEELRAKRALATIKLGDPPGGLELAVDLEPETLEGKTAHALALSGAAALGFADPKLGTAKAAEARRLALEAGDSDAVVIASWAQAAAAHARGELRDSLQADLRDTHGLGALAVSVFDGQLCMTQRLLYGARPYEDVIVFADSLEEEAKRLGAKRGRAFAVTIRGEAKFLAGRLDDADADLAEGAQLHREIAAATGEAFALQRRSEVALARGDAEEAAALIDQALAVARDSDVGFHLLDRIYGTRITAAADGDHALAALDEAEEAVRGPFETCPTCRITLALPAAVAAARSGDPERLAEWEPIAEYLVTVVMRLPAWDAALEELRGHKARLEGDPLLARRHFKNAAEIFALAGQPLDRARCENLAAA